MNHFNIVKSVEKVFNNLKRNGNILSYIELESLYGKDKTADSLDLKILLQNYSQIFELDEQHNVLLKTGLRICEEYLATEGCLNSKCKCLHLCKFHICNRCTFAEHDCRFGHSMNDFNKNILKQYKLDVLSLQNLFHVIKCSDPTFIPQPCKFYNNGNCTKNKCLFLHICQYYLKGECAYNIKCKRSHNIYDEQPKIILDKHGVDVNRSPKDVLTWLRKHLPNGKKKELYNDNCLLEKAKGFKINSESEICLYFLQEKCSYGKSCQNLHVKEPYSWFYFSSKLNKWFHFENSDVLELYFCNPAKMECYIRTKIGDLSEDEYSMEYFVLVNFFDWSVKGIPDVPLAAVRRVGTPSYGNNMNSMATKWIWYWQHNDESWIKYGEEEFGSFKIISSYIIEKTYLSKARHFEFLLNGYKYNIDFETFQQKNVKTGRVRNIRRRPLLIELEKNQ